MIAKIYKEEGLLGFYKGIIPSIILTLNPVVNYTLYEFLKTGFSSTNKPTSKQILIASFVSKFITNIVSYPLTSVKTLFQANKSKPTKDILNLILLVLKEEGIQGFYKGISTKMLGSLLNNAVLMVTYEQIQVTIRKILIFIITKRLK